MESIENGRPLTVVSDDPNDETPLIPDPRGRSHLITSLLTRVIYLDGDGDMFSSSLTSFGGAGFGSIYSHCSCV